MWTQRPQCDVTTVMSVAREKVNDGDKDKETVKQYGNGPVHRAQCGHGVLGVQVGE